MTSTTFFFVFIPLLAIILLAVNIIFAPHNPYQEKDSTFECGFHSFLGQNRTQFSISFFIFALLFLLFDLEILLVYPYVVSAYANGIYGLMVMLIFFLALTLGFAFELGKNALKIDSRQMLTFVSPKNSSILVYISGFNKIFSKLFQYFTMERIVAGLISLSLIILLRYIIYGGFSTNPLKWWEGFTVGIPAIFIKLGVNGIIDWVFKDLGFKNIIIDIWNGPRDNYGLIIKSATPIDKNNTPAWVSSNNSTQSNNSMQSNSRNTGNSQYTHVSSGNSEYTDLNSYNSHNKKFSSRYKYAGKPILTWINLIENNFACRNSKFGFPYWLYRPEVSLPRLNPISPEPENFVNINKPSWDRLKEHFHAKRALEYQYRTVSNDMYKELKIFSIAWKALYKQPNFWTTEENLCVNQVRQELNYNGNDFRFFQMKIRQQQQTLFAKLDYANQEEDKANLLSIDILKETEDFIKANPKNCEEASIYFSKLLFYFPKSWNCATPISNPNAPGLNIIPPGCSAYPPTLDIMILNPNIPSSSSTPISTSSNTATSNSNHSNSSSNPTGSNHPRRPRGSSSNNRVSQHSRRQPRSLYPSSLVSSSSNLNPNSSGLSSYASSSTSNPPSYDTDSTRWGLNGTGLITDSSSSTSNPPSYDNNPLGLNSNRLGYNTNPLGLNSNSSSSNSNVQSRSLNPAPSGLNSTWGLNSNTSILNDSERRIANSNRRFKRRR